MRRLVAAAAALALCVADGVRAQEPRFSVSSELVVLNVSVTDRSGHFVRGLPANAFHVMEEGEPRSIDFFAEQDTPATIALLVDGSGSMWKNRSLVVAAIGALAEASHPDDEFLPLLFNERLIHVLPPSSPTTNDPARLRQALAAALGARGRTGLYDAVIGALRELAPRDRERQVLVVLSDGGDNASRSSFEQMMSHVLASNVVIYGVALEDPLSIERNPKTLRRMAQVTGGIAYQPRSPSAVTRAMQAVASDIRSRYTLGYVPDAASAGSDIRHVEVSVNAPRRGHLNVRTRIGYEPGGAGRAISECGQGEER